MIHFSQLSALLTIKTSECTFIWCLYLWGTSRLDWLNSTELSMLSWIDQMALLNGLFQLSGGGCPSLLTECLSFDTLSPPDRNVEWSGGSPGGGGCRLYYTLSSTENQVKWGMKHLLGRAPRSAFFTDISFLRSRRVCLFMLVLSGKTYFCSMVMLLPIHLVVTQTELIFISRGFKV